MRRLQPILWAALALFTLAVIGIATAPRVRAAIKAAFVEVVLPSQPFSDSMELQGNDVNSIGLDTGTIGVTSITMTNYNTTRQEVSIFATRFSGGRCGVGTRIEAGHTFNVFLQPLETLHLTYPSPLVFSFFSGSGPVCIAGATTNTNQARVFVFVNGFVN